MLILININQRQLTSIKMTKNIPITEARINLGAIVKRVRVNKETFILEKDGFPVAGLVDIDLLEDLLELQSKKINDELLVSQKEAVKGELKDARSII
jgi:hypothetical protein